MKAKLDALSLEVEDTFLQGNDVHVEFEYEYLNDYEVKFFLFTYVGKSQYEYRFCLKMVYIVDFENKKIEDEVSMIQESIDAILPSITDFIIAVDTHIQDRRH